MTTNQTENDYICPTFSSYSSDRLAETAGRVADETSTSAAADDFEFVFVRHDAEQFLADDFFRGGQVFPVFKHTDESDPPDSGAAISLSNLFIDEDRERGYPPSCSSSASEVDDCVWRPKAASPADPPMPSQCEKSKSTGSASARWKFRDLMRRSKSDGKESYVFLTPKGKSGGRVVGSGSGSGGAPARLRSAHEEFYVRNKAMREGDKRKSYLPYRQELVGLFANVNGFSRSRLAHP